MSVAVVTNGACHRGIHLGTTHPITLGMTVIGTRPGIILHGISDGMIPGTIVPTMVAIMVTMAITDGVGHITTVAVIRERAPMHGMATPAPLVALARHTDASPDRVPL